MSKKDAGYREVIECLISLQVVQTMFELSDSLIGRIGFNPIYDVMCKSIASSELIQFLRKHLPCLPTQIYQAI
jgi:hypothetical protein